MNDHRERCDRRDWGDQFGEFLLEWLTALDDRLETLTNRVTALEQTQPPGPGQPGPPASCTIHITPTPTKDPATMNDQLVVTDPTARHAVITFQDAKGNVATPPAGALVSFTSSDPTLLACDPPTGALTIVGPVGKCQLSAVPTNADGTPMLGPDGVTPIPVIPDDVDLIAGPPATGAVGIA